MLVPVEDPGAIIESPFAGVDPKLWMVPAFAPSVNAGDPTSLKSPSQTPEVPETMFPSLPAEEKYIQPLDVS